MNRQRARLVLLFFWLLLLAVLITWWLTGISRPAQLADLVGAFLILPLVVILPAISKGSQRASASASLLLIPYIGWGLTEAVANPDARLLAAATVFAGTASFAALIIWLRILRAV